MIIPTVNFRTNDPSISTNANTSGNLVTNNVVGNVNNQQTFPTTGSISGNFVTSNIASNQNI